LYARYFHRLNKVNLNGVLRLLSLVIVIGLVTLPLLVRAEGGRDSLISSPEITPQGPAFTVVVIDQSVRAPLEYARVMLRRNGTLVAGRISDASGMAVFKDIKYGRYVLQVHLVGYTEFTDTITITAAHVIDTVLLSESEQEVTVGASVEPPVSTVEVKTGNQQYEPQTVHTPPQAQMTDVIATNVTGAVRAPTGEVHVRGQHGEFTYYVDGVPIPLSAFGGLNEVVDPKVIDHATFLTGGFPAEYGGQMAAIMDIHNRVPAGRFHLDAETYAGTYGLSALKDSLGNKVTGINSNGQTLAMSGHVGDLGVFVSGTREETDRRIDPPVEQLYHDHGFDYFLYGKADYVLSDADYLTLNLNWSRTATQVPFDPVEQITDDYQTASNAFQTLTYYRSLSTALDRESNFFMAGYAREGQLLFTPGATDIPNFQFAGDTSSYNLAEGRSFITTGVRTKFDDRLSHQFQYAVGAEFSSTRGSEKFTPQSLIAQHSAVNSSFVGSDFGVFAQTNWHPLEWTSLDVGARYDQHIAPDIALQNQISPRIKWDFIFDEFNDAYLYYGRLFMPPNIEGLRTIASNVAAGTEGTQAERDNFFEAVYNRNWEFGLVTKLAGYYKLAQPGLDDQTLGSSAIKTSVNIATVKVTGVELALTYNLPNSPFSAFANGAISHAYGEGAVTGGFLATDTSGGVFDLDHDQRLSLALGINYQPEDWFANMTASYGSGLSNGNKDVIFKTGLFDFNQAAHVTPAWIINASIGKTFQWDSHFSIEPSLYITNLLDHEHLLKGSSFSAASWEEPRNVVLRVKVHY